MPNKMLIDASHPEETRVVVTRGNRIEEFDFESQDKKQLRGNIYLARVTRVEPSLQAAFVEYGGNRHGFLAFSEIHPDYYQIPVADRQALLRAEAEEHEDEDDDEDGDGENRQERGGRGRRRRRGRHRDRKELSGAEGSDEAKAAGDDEANETGDENEAGGDSLEARDAESDAETNSDSDDEREVEASASDEAVLTPSSDEAVEKEISEEADEEVAGDTSDDEEGRGGGSIAAAVDADVISEPVETERSTEAGGENGETAPDADSDRGTVEEVSPNGNGDGEVESVGAEDALEEIRERRRPMRRHYKIQEVIKRRQILLVQVVKEERGNKGAALTTYLSLAGRYSVLMPNTARGGGISRKITNAQDRKRLKDVVKDLDVPQGMGVILRTAGENRTKAEIKRDYEYLMRLWETVRNTTLQSTAPALVYEEGSLIKRSVRDLYNKDIDEILVAGEDGYREAKDFMRMLMPSHAKVVQPYRDTVPIFARSGIEGQLDKMLQPQVTLKSGGYIIINQTEALVSIDVNSGRSTREHSIEDTALQTNLEAAEEVSRQLRLRDLAGLIVIDFIDMEENRNNRAVEKKLKDCLKNDRARIQVGRISHFGLLEMSRQRIRASMLESTMKPCPHCGGTGHVRSDSSVALHVVRAIEEFLMKDSRSHITVKTPTATALYVLNHKRVKLAELEARFGVTITLEADEEVGAQHYQIFRGAIAEKPADFVPVVSAPAPVEEPDEPAIEVADEDEAEDQPSERQQRLDGEEGERHHDRKRRRRRRRGGRDREHRHGGEQPHVSADAIEGVHPEGANDDDEAGEDAAEQAATAQASGEDRKKRRRGKRGGKRNRARDGEAGEAQAGGEGTDGDVSVSDGGHDVEAGSEADASEEPVVNGEDGYEQPAVAETEAAGDEIRAPEPAEEPARASRRRASSEAPSEPVVSSSSATPDADKPKKGGWWQRKGFF